MPLSVEETKRIIEQYGRNSSDTGSSRVQIALLTRRIEGLQSHFEENKKDNHSRRGLIRMVNRRKTLLSYLHKTNPTDYQELIKDLGLRR